MQYKYYLLSDWTNQALPSMPDWPVEGRVEVLDWNPDPGHDGGIWGYLHEPASNLLPALIESNPSAEKTTALVKTPSQWVVLGADEIVRLEDQVVKCPWGVVLYCGDRASALAFADLLQENSIASNRTSCDYLGELSRRKYMFIGKRGAAITTGAESLVIGAGHTSINGGDHSTLIGGRRANIVGGHRSIISSGKGSKVTVGNKATIAGSDNTEAHAGHSSTVVGGYKSTLAGGTLSTVVGGYKSCVTGGYGATVVGGEKARVTGGDYATVIGGDDALVCGGKNAMVFGGLRAKVSGGIDATLRIAYLDEKGERNVSTAYVGRFGILPGVLYSFDGRSWCTEELIQSKSAS